MSRSSENSKGALRWMAMVVVALGGCGQGEDSPRSGAGASTMAVRPTIHAAVVEVKVAEVPVSVEVTGQVTALYQATLASRIQGTIDELLVREGSAVRKGQTLVVLDNRDLQAELARMAAELDNADAQRKRMEDLYRKDAVSKQELENATRAFRVAEAGRKAVLAQLSYTVVKAPFDGVITEKKVEVGELASPGQPLLRMEDPTRLRLEAMVAEGDVGLVTVGAPVPVVIDALGPEPLQGTVSQILPAGDPQTHTFTMKVELPKQPRVKSGMFGRLRLERGASRTLVVPHRALIERGELAGLFVVEQDQVARLRWVKLGRPLGQGTEVLSGVSAGERILADSAKGEDGALVQDVTAAAMPSSRAE